MPLRHVLTILAVDDLPGAVAFYRDGLGFAQTVDAPSYAEMALDGMRLGLYRRDGFAKNVGNEVPATIPPDSIAPTELYFHTDDLAGAIEKLKLVGARRLSARARRDWGEDVAYFADPEGNVIAIATPS